MLWTQHSFFGLSGSDYLVKLLGPLLAEQAPFSHVFLQHMYFRCLLVEIGGTVCLDDIKTSPNFVQEALCFFAIPAKRKTG
jgi:hypothetical protein